MDPHLLPSVIAASASVTSCNQSIVALFLQSMTITGCTFKADPRYSIVRIESSNLDYPSKFEITNNSFTSVGKVIDALHSYNSPSCIYEVVGNDFYSSDTTNSGKQIISIEAQNVHKISIHSNSFSGPITAIRLRLNNHARSPDSDDRVIIRGNTFTDMVSPMIVDLQSSSYQPATLLSNNVFTNCSADAVVVSEGLSTRVTDNFFENPYSTYDLKVTASTVESLPLYATRNWWGSAVFADIGSRIYDNAQDSSVSAVVFQPYLLSPTGGQLSELIQSFLRSDFEIGGILSSDVVLDRTDEAYVVVEDIVVPQGRSLTIGPGVNLRFKQGGIIVKGLTYILLLHSCYLFIQHLFHCFALV